MRRTGASVSANMPKNFPDAWIAGSRVVMGIAVEAPVKALEAPGIAGRELLELWVEGGLGDFGQEAYRHEDLGKCGVDERLCLDVGEHAFFQEFDLAREAAEVLLEAQDSAGEFDAQVKARGVLAPEGDHVAAKSQVVADKHGESVSAECKICSPSMRIWF
jgi:hypothetical protein